ncbi:MAG: TIGR00282 family metallophosphoesterase, partial [Chloroflexota bacterium]|nr:TIGR00282 family metallophosphoesterase [Chloroflexota bacterium]
ELQLDLVIANGENSAGGRGLTAATAEELFRSGVDVITSGNHIWHDKEVIAYLERNVPVVRPLNYPPGVPGRGFLIHDLGAKGQVLVVNLCGRVTMPELDCPFRAMDRLLESLPSRPVVSIVDMHAEATSEKSAMGWYLDGRVSAVVGTHTHVPTADARVLPGGTAFVSDLGMVGPRDSVIGVKVEPIIQHFLTCMPARFDVAEGPVSFNAVLIVVDDVSGHAVSIERVDRLL